jgi:hypothetical protein
MKRLVAVVIAAVALGLVPAALAAGMLSGAYTTKITGDPALGGALNGTWKITFTSGHYKVAHNGKSFGQGVDKVNGDKITFLNGANCSSVGKYRFKLTGKKLTFTEISDACMGRPNVLTHGQFHKVS